MSRVQHSKKAMEFFIKFDTGSKAFLQYHKLPSGDLEFAHTETPQDQQGKGVGKLLVQEGFKYAAENKLKVLPTCPYAAKYVDNYGTEQEKDVVIRSSSIMNRVQHSKKAMEFFIKFDTGSRAFLQYQELPNGILDFAHTVTPQDQQGQGIAKLLVQEGFKYAAENNLKVLPTCSYVAKYVNDYGSQQEKEITIKSSL